MKRGFVAALFESPTCASWSIASKRPCLRSCAWPQGLPNLQSKAQNKVAVGNQEGWIALGFLKNSYECNVPAALEHLSSSYLLKTDDFFHIVKTCHAKLADFHPCCFGAKWWKPTTLVSVGKTDQQTIGFVGLANNASANTIIVFLLDCLMSSS